jgi:hypothetical protein
MEKKQYRFRVIDTQVVQYLSAFGAYSWVMPSALIALFESFQ